MFFGILHPRAALFSCVFNPKEASNEHKNYIKEIEKGGATVYTVR